MLFYNSTIHDFDLARWLVRDEVSEVQAYTTCAIRPEVAQFGDIVAGVVNLKYQRGAIGNIESYVQCVYGYDIRTEIVGSKGSILVGSLQGHSATLLSSDGGAETLADHFLSRFTDAYLAEVKDFVHNMLNDQAPRVTGEDGMRALEIAVAAENSHLQSNLQGHGSRFGGIMTRATAVTYKSPLHEMTQTTATCLWNDSASIQELSYSIEHGAVGATCNPVIVLGLLKKEMNLWKDRIDGLIQELPAATEDEIAWQLVREVSVKGAGLLKPIFDAQHAGMEGSRFKPIPGCFVTPRPW